MGGLNFHDNKKEGKKRKSPKNSCFIKIKILVNKQWNQTAGKRINNTCKVSVKPRNFAVYQIVILRLYGYACAFSDIDYKKCQPWYRLGM